MKQNMKSLANENSKMYRKQLLRQGLRIFALAFAHCIASFFAVMTSFGDLMARFDTGADETSQEHFARRIADILTFPGETINEHFGPVYLGRWADLISFSNSVLWALCFRACILGVTFLTRQRRKPCVGTHGQTV